MQISYENSFLCDAEIELSIRETGNKFAEKCSYQTDVHKANQ